MPPRHGSITLADMDPLCADGRAGQRRAQSPSLEQLKDQISDVLSNAHGPSAFACGGALENAQNPGLYLEDHGMIGLPLSQHDAQTIISKSQQSPFGKGSQTIVDTSIRKSWQLDPAQFTIRNPQWQQAIDNVARKIHRELALDIEPDNFSAELYKLLLYEPGAFFKPHKDSEKAPGMFGTLAICLPSAHEGGELILTFNGETKSIETAPNSGFAMSYAAWYADVLHEVKPVTAGYRLVLTYNLIRHGAPQGGQVTPAKSFEEKYNLIAALTKYNEYLQQFDDLPNFLVYRLQHQYTQASLRADLLKGADLGQLQCLKQVADELGFELYLANMEKEITKTDDGYDDRRYGYYDDEEEDEQDDEEEEEREEGEEEEEEISRSITLTYIADLAGSRMDHPVNFAERGLEVDEENIVDSTDEDEEEPDDEEHSGYTGNEGCTATFRYRNTVMVIVPPARKVEFLYECDRRNLRVTALLRDLRQKAENDPQANEDLMKVCELVLANKNENRYWRRDQESAHILIQEAIASAVQCDRFDLYDGLIQGINDSQSREVFRLLGRHLGREVRPEIAQRIEAALGLASTLIQKHEYLMIVGEGVQSNLRSDEMLPVQYSVWAQQVLVRQLVAAADAQKLSKADGAALVNIIGEWTAKDVREHIIPAIAKCGTAFQVAFANCLVARVDDVETTTELDEASLLTFSPQACLSVSRAVYTNIWMSFELESLPEAPIATTRAPGGIYGMYGTPPRVPPAPRPEERLLGGSELARSLRHTSSLGVLTDSEMKSRLRSAVGAADREACIHTLLPFVKLVLQQQVESLKLDPESNRASDEDKNLVTAMLVRFIVAGVGREPAAPGTWSQRTGGCRSSSCSDCSSVNAFLAAPDRIVGKFPVGKARRHHLHSFFADKAGANYSVTTLRNSNPNVWQITKNPSKAQVDHDTWKTRKAEAQKMISQLVKTGRFHMYVLHGAALGIIDADVTMLKLPPGPGEQIPAGVLPLQPSSANVPSTSRFKRPALEDPDPEQEERSKKAKAKPTTSGTESLRPRHGLVEVIDLT
ncbi:hypothetical protein G647_03995 [Cladophialophora carrionii CBS 160.54]|uniref:Fe2OG dioxygenase domain-containing protein n=1 Tax=Cladophialophora carrionii CBS 160.54 TaxID=1279043 RepID=V9DD59_9EURO|nr:uncharacterized protein G647_03995 [Cladophialophora carrionii CBS 160.54]ETI24626.1 hypothetical protein G647_03995 [Cladophialophora carrionii CBS 160.54]